MRSYLKITAVALAATLVAALGFSAAADVRTGTTGPEIASASAPLGLADLQAAFFGAEAADRSLDRADVPQPTTALLMVIGLAGLAIEGRRRA